MMIANFLRGPRAIPSSGVVAVCAGLLLTACGEAPANVSIDFSNLEAQAAVLGMPLNQVRVQARPDTFVPTDEDLQIKEVPISELSFEMEIPAGRWLLEAIGVRSNVDPPVPTYFGDAHLELAPLDRVDLLVPMFPAGQLDVEVTVPEGTDLPSDALIRFVAAAPRTDQAESYTAPFASGQLSRVLPTGTYTVHGEVSFDGTNYVVAGEEIEVTIEHGVLHDVHILIE